MSEQPRLIAALILATAAGSLDTEPTGILTETGWAEVFNTAAAKINDGIGVTDADAAVDIAWHAIPPTPLGATRAEWAQQVRRVAGGDLMDTNLRTLLITMADRLDQDPEHDPAAPFANTQRVALASELTDDEPLFDELIIAAPVITAPTTRSAYADRLRTIAGA